jgi:uncharacterized RDD family membrane protein YckC
MQQPLFEGPGSLRHPSERLAFWLTALFAFPAAAIVGFFLHQTIGISQVALFIVAAMIFVTLARGRLLGSSVMLHQTQYPRVFAIVKRASAALEIPMPLVFAREDNLVPVAALGFGEPYALVISSHWIEVFGDDELAFMIGRELGHIAAGHTRYLSLLSVNGNENAFVSAIFGAWLRRCTTTCDRIGLLCCGSLDAAIRAIGVASFHEFGRRIDYAAFAEQYKEIENDAVMRWGAWLGSEPYATVRIASLRQFMTSHAYEIAEKWFLRERTDEPPALPTPGASTVERVDCSGWWRRFWAFSIDVIVVLAILGSLHGILSSPSEVTVPAPTPSVKAAHPVHHYYNTIVLPNGWKFDESTALAFIPASRTTILLATYLTVLVAVVGQTFGMMIMGLRVVTRDFRRPGPARTIFRYVIAALLWPLILIISPFARRIYLHDKFTGTRVITVERLLERVLTSRA